MGCCSGVLARSTLCSFVLVNGKYILVVGLEGLVVHVPLQTASFVRVESDVDLLCSRWRTYRRVREIWNSHVQRILINETLAR